MRSRCNYWSNLEFSGVLKSNLLASNFNLMLQMIHGYLSSIYIPFLTVHWEIILLMLGRRLPSLKRIESCPDAWTPRPRNLLSLVIVVFSYSLANASRCRHLVRVPVSCRRQIARWLLFNNVQGGRGSMPLLRTDVWGWFVLSSTIRTTRRQTRTLSLPAVPLCSSTIDWTRLSVNVNTTLSSFLCLICCLFSEFFHCLQSTQLHCSVRVNASEHKRNSWFFSSHFRSKNNTGEDLSCLIIHSLCFPLSSQRTSVVLNSAINLREEHAETGVNKLWNSFRRFTTLYATDTGSPHLCLSLPAAALSLTCLLARLIKPVPSLSCHECVVGFCDRGCYTNIDKQALPFTYSLPLFTFRLFFLWVCPWRQPLGNLPRENVFN